MRHDLMRRGMYDWKLMKVRKGWITMACEGLDAH